MSHHHIIRFQTSSRFAHRPAVSRSGSQEVAPTLAHQQVAFLILRVKKEFEAAVQVTSVRVPISSCHRDITASSGGPEKLSRSDLQADRSQARGDMNRYETIKDDIHPVKFTRFLAELVGMRDGKSRGKAGPIHDSTTRVKFTTTGTTPLNRQSEA